MAHNKKKNNMARRSSEYIFKFGYDFGRDMGVSGSDISTHTHFAHLRPFHLYLTPEFENIIQVPLSQWFPLSKEPQF